MSNNPKKRRTGRSEGVHNPRDRSLLVEMGKVDTHLEQLNDEQRRAVLHRDGPILILAGAGSGKTRVLTNRVANLVLNHRVRPSAILAVTFTNKATEEMRERLRSLLGERGDRLWVATFHSACVRILRRHASLLGYTNSFVIYDDQDSKAVIKRLVKEMKIDEKRYPPAGFSAMIDRAKNALITSEKASSKSSTFSMLDTEIYTRYQLELRQANAMDFGDLLLNTVELFSKHPEVLRDYRENIHYLLVDEFQDTNIAQYMLIRMLGEPRCNIFVVGDDDQSIYAFRGATVGNILNFEKNYPDATVITLEQNYRSTGNILEAAHGVIEKNTQRKPKKLWTAAGQGPPILTFVADDEGEEACFIADEIRKHLKEQTEADSIAIFYRTNAQSRALEEALLDRGIPYRVFGGLKFYERKEVKDIIAYLRLIVNHDDNQAFLRVFNTPPRGIGAQALQRITDSAAKLNNSLWQGALLLSKSNGKIKVFCSLMEKLTSLASQATLAELINNIFEESGYHARLKASPEANALSRVENIQELQGIAMMMERPDVPSEQLIHEFLDRVSLSASSDKPSQENNVEGEYVRSVSLMTLHIAKGLEFPIVFLTGIEEGLLPHYRSLGDDEAIEEERRLCYVGLTRAMQQLYLTRARHRSMFSARAKYEAMPYYRKASRFLSHLPKDCLKSKGGDICGDVYYQDNDLDFLDEEEETLTIPWGRKERKKKQWSVTGSLKSADQLALPSEAKYNERKSHKTAKADLTPPKGGNVLKFKKTR